MTFSSIHYNEVKTEAGNFYVREGGKVKHKSIPMCFQILWRDMTEEERVLIANGRSINSGRVSTLDKEITQKQKRRIERHNYEKEKHGA